MSEIPAPVYSADSKLHLFFQKLSFSAYLNPINTQEAKKAFFTGASTPPFAYNPLLRADEYLYRLDTIRLDFKHPLATLINQKIDSTQLLIYALRDRSAEAFDALSRYNNWYPDQKILENSIPLENDFSPLDKPAEILIEAFKKALIERGLNDWKIRTDTVMSARVQVDGTKRELIVHPLALFRSRDIQRLIVHEIDVHAQRANNGRDQTLKCFSMGLPGSLITEEGLAMLAEELNGLQSPGTLARQYQVVRAIQLAQHMGFKELFQILRQTCGAPLAWSISLRIKRGLARPEQAGVYAKDSVYLVGYHRLKNWLGAGGDIRTLYVGDVGIEHQIPLWIDEGWITLKPTPEFWLSDSTKKYFQQS